MVEEVVKVKVETGEATKQVENLNKETKKTGRNIDEIQNQADKLTGGLISKFKSFTATLKGVAIGFKGVGTAIAATGLGALVLVVTSLVAAFKSSEEGQNKFAKIMGVIGALTGNLVDLLADLGEKLIWVFENPMEALRNFGTAIKENVENRIEGMLEFIPALGKAIKLALSGEFSEAGKVATDAFAKMTLGIENVTDKVSAAAEATKNFVKEQINEGKAAAQVADMRAKADKIERSLLVERSEMEQKIAELRLKARQEDQFSAEERKDALLEAQNLEDGLLNKELEYLQLRADAQTMENTFARSNKENLDEEARLIAAVNNQMVLRTNQQRSTQRELNRINNEISAEEKQRRTEQAAFEKELRDALALDKDEKRALEIEKEEEKYNNLIAQAQKYGLDTIEIEDAKLQALKILNDKYIAEDKKAKDELAEKEKQAQQKSIELAKKEAETKRNIANQLIGAIMANLEQGSVEQKALAVAQATWNTYEAVTAALGAKPYGAWNIAQAVATGLFGLAQVRSILQTNPASGGGGGAAPSGASFTPPSVNIPGQANVNSIIQGFQTGNTPVQAYVVSGEVNSGAELERKRLANATFG
jgi:hypothetical protein